MFAPRGTGHGHDHHIHVQAVLPGPVRSNIFESAGGVDPGAAGDAAAETQRSSMLGIKAASMDPLEAAERIFGQSAEGRFYLHTHPDSVGAAMAERANVLAAQQPHDCGPRPGSNPHRTDVTAT